MGAVDFKRSPAVLTTIGTVLAGRYVSSDDEPNHIFIAGRKLARVNIVASVTAVEGMAAMIDDSHQIQLRSFEGEFSAVQVGDIVNVIGKPREYNGQKYIVPEIIRKVDADVVRLRKLQLGKEGFVHEEQEPSSPAPAPAVKESDHNTSAYDSIAAAIRALDQGDGADTDEVISETGVGEAAINRLLEEGEIFEVKPGKLKVLE